MFEEILKPAKRRNVNVPESLPWGPVGTIGDHSIVESPFRCEYGYNIRIGEDCIIESGAYLQDAALLFIGNGVRIGHNVKLYSLTAAMGPRERKGSRGNLVAGAVKIEDDCIIESDVSVLPFVTIGRGAVVRAGSIVTEVGQARIYRHIIGSLIACCRMSKETLKWQATQQSSCGVSTVRMLVFTTTPKSRGSRAQCRSGWSIM